MTNSMMSTNGKHALEIKDLHCYYGTFRAVKNSTLNIEVNKITAFIVRRAVVKAPCCGPSIA